MSKLLTVEDLTNYLGISRAMAYKMIREMKHTKIGRRFLVAEEDLQDYLQQNAENEKTKNT